MLKLWMFAGLRTCHLRYAQHATTFKRVCLHSLCWQMTGVKVTTNDNRSAEPEGAPWGLKSCNYRASFLQKPNKTKNWQRCRLTTTECFSQVAKLSILPRFGSKEPVVDCILRPQKEKSLQSQEYHFESSLQGSYDDHSSLSNGYVSTQNLFGTMLYIFLR